MSLNRFQFIGNLCFDTELAQTSAGKTRATFVLAVNQVRRDDQGNKQETADFFRIKAFGPMGENAGRYLGKGSKVMVEGRLSPFEYEKDGEKLHGMDFIAQSIEYLATKRPGSAVEGPGEG